MVDIQSDHIVLENNGIGYLIYVSNPYAFSKGKEVVVYLYQQVKEDGILLYGFNLKEEKDLFLKEDFAEEMAAKGKSNPIL